MHERARLRGTAATLVIGILVAACGSPAPSASGSTGDSSVSSSPSPSPINASRTIRIGIYEPITVLSNAATNQASSAALPFIFNGVYQLDPNLIPVPDLAAEPCNISVDELTGRCTLREARFHSGIEATGEDVAYTYGLARSPRCTFRENLCLSTLLADVEAEGDRTVVFTLAEPYGRRRGPPGIRRTQTRHLLRIRAVIRPRPEFLARAPSPARRSRS